MRKAFWWSAILLSAVSCWAQKNEFDVVLGQTWSFNSNTTVTFPSFSPFEVPTGQVSNLTYKLGYARRLASLGPGALSLEIMAAGFPAQETFHVSFASLFLVPAAKFSFRLPGPVTPFVSAGVGYVHLAKGGFSPTNAVASEFGGGADVNTPFRFFKLRGEVRDFLASQSGVDNISSAVSGVTSKSSFRNHLLLGGGAVLRF